ncbi:ankyrin repeat-containing protein NPR4-like [Chenopodium quinoa]|uniref:PGG domain-containing protein n=1 Tax=Chenopodium quinoa TaxID=63459 RepID=A0A803NCP6_CHEQI|nr:ankyrin repeat-containing protein NPR4-like [Chenopodium quinoa]
MAELVDQIKRSTPLHIAAAKKGWLPIVEMLLEVKPNMCFVHDQDGMTPLHVAAVNGNTDVLKEFLKKKHQAALERTTKGETILHLCVKNCQLDTLKALVKDTYDLELLNSGDNDGNTVLHLAVAYKEYKMLEFLLEQGDNKIDKNAMNEKNKTTMDIFDLTKIRKDSDEDRKANENNLAQCLCTIVGWEDEKWLEEQNTALMVVASCIATLSFQVGINPPGSVWTDNEQGHVAGTSIMSYDTDKDSYNLVQVSNTVGLMSSLSVILLLISGLPCKGHFVFILRVTLWIAVTASAVTYFYTIGYITNELGDKAVLVDAMEYSVEVWLWLMMVILFGHGVRFIWKIMGHERRANIKKTLKTDKWSQYC